MTSYPMTPDDVRRLALEASEAIRVLNHATMPANGCPGLAYPSDAYTVVGALAELAGRLPQLLEQTSVFLQRQLQFDLIDVDGGEFAGDPLGAVGTASHALESCAARSAQHVAGALMRAQQAIAFATFNGENAPENQ